ncbi:hypothetical protein Cgig2_033360 [Carnegiea gigantea]|uniref:K-box domain-containing protein n=1 Tax=Carnegiea gigantea TaxID=171969 RepID=A0A9Q1QQP0_9CARY|nr:hypothetical protein Cgig2_033360 [Carnegiea gigantea]
MQETIVRYQRHTRQTHPTDETTAEESMQSLKEEAAILTKRIETIEASKRRLLGENLASCTLEELQQLENQLERSVSKVRSRKSQVFCEQIRQLRDKEKRLAAENARLAEQCALRTKEPSNQPTEDTPSEDTNSQISEVETDLFIGLPESRIKRVN